MFKIGDRVVRSNGKGCEGTVNLIKREVFGTEESKDAALMIRVQWDSGTESYFAPEGLKLV